MGLLAKEKGGDFKKLDEGTHLAICDAVVGVGMQDTPWGTQQEHVWVRFEVPAERVQFVRDGIEVDEPMTIWTRYNNTLNRKSSLRKDLDTWRGRKFTVEELQGFELFDLVGRHCQITVVHNESKDNIYANVAAIAQVMKGIERPPMELNTIRFGPDDTDQYNELPEWLQKIFDDRVRLEDVAEEPTSNDDFESDDPEDIDW
jgi:hypothetical protein